MISRGSQESHSKQMVIPIFSTYFSGTTKIAIHFLFRLGGNLDKQRKKRRNISWNLVNLFKHSSMKHKIVNHTNFPTHHLKRNRITKRAWPCPGSGKTTYERRKFTKKKHSGTPRESLSQQTTCKSFTLTIGNRKLALLPTWSKLTQWFLYSKDTGTLFWWSRW